MSPWPVVCSGKVGRSAAIAQVAVPKAQMVPRQDWSYVAGAKANLQGAQERNSAISCLRFSADNNTLLSRCGDDTLKVGSDGGQVQCWLLQNSSGKSPNLREQTQQPGDIVLGICCRVHLVPR